MQKETPILMLSTKKIGVPVYDTCFQAQIQALKIDKDAKHTDFKAINPIKF